MGKMAILTRDAILSADDLTVTEVPVPEWGGTVLVRAMSGAERDKLEASLIGKDGKTDGSKLATFRSRLAAVCMVDENGDRLFGDAEVQVLARKSASALNRVAEAAQKAAGISDEDAEELAGE